MKSWIWGQIEAHFEHVTPRLFSGLTHNELPRYVGRDLDFLYLDNAYFKRGSRSNHFRLIRKGFHLTRLLNRPDDRMKQLGLRCQPWRKTGRHIVLIPPSVWYLRILGAHDWTAQTLVTLSQVTDRPVRVKWDKKLPLSDWLADAWAVVTYGSVAGVESAIAGVPVFAGAICPCLPITAGPIDRIDTPEYHDREPWLASLAYANWSTAELDSINLEDYDYSCRNNVP